MQAVDYKKIVPQKLDISLWKKYKKSKNTIHYTLKIRQNIFTVILQNVMSVGMDQST